MNSRTLRRQEAADKAPSKIIKPVVENTWATVDELVLIDLEDDFVANFCATDEQNLHLQWFAANNLMTSLESS